MIEAIAAINPWGVIGKTDGSIPWNHPSDLDFFKHRTMGSACLFGSATFETLPKLKGRIKCCLSSNFTDENHFENVEDFIQEHKDGYICGGARTYAAADEFIERWTITRIPDYIPHSNDLVYMPRDFLDSFEIDEEFQLDSGLWVKEFHRVVNDD